MKKWWIAQTIEYHWLMIRNLRKQLTNAADRETEQRILHKIQLHRYEADQLGCLYEVLSGLRPVE